MATDVSHDPAGSQDATAAGPNLPASADALRILFVENDDDYRKALAEELFSHGFAVRDFPDGDSLLSAFDAVFDADVILLAWNLPKTPGIDLVPRLRRRGVTLPIIFLTSYSRLENERMAFATGAVDFIDKARGVDVLVRRLRRLRRLVSAANDPQSDKAFLCSKLMLRPAISRAYWDQVDVSLTVGEYNVVHLLASNVGQYVTYRAIYDRLHYEGFLAGKGLDGYRVNVRSIIKRIRQKFHAIDPTFEVIETYQSFGYRWGKSPKLRAMKWSRFKEEQIIRILKEHQAGLSAQDLCRKYGVSDATFYKWRSKYGGMDVSDARKLKALEDEDRRLKKLLAESMLDAATPKEMLRKNF